MALGATPSSPGKTKSGFFKGQGVTPSSHHVFLYCLLQPWGIKLELFLFYFSIFPFWIQHIAPKRDRTWGAWGVDLDLDDVDVLLGFNP